LEAERDSLRSEVERLSRLDIADAIIAKGRRQIAELREENKAMRELLAQWEDGAFVDDRSHEVFAKTRAILQAAAKDRWE
jgi:hypothetical protein